MMTRRILVNAGIASLAVAAGIFRRTPRAFAGERFAVTHTDAEWRKLLDPSQYTVLRQERHRAHPSPALLDEHRDGTSSAPAATTSCSPRTTKFESGTGWPSFWAPLDKAVGTEDDTILGMIRTAVHCSRCGGHLGHVFDDGPQPTGLRYCMNGVAMTFKPAA